MTKEEKNQTNKEKIQTSEEKKYFAFISYSHKDKDAAKKLQNFIQGYKIPAKLEDRPDLPKRIGRVFRDEDELAGDELTPQIEEALRQSRYLIVVCSPNSAKSKYVNEEIEYFKSLGGETKILPYIIAGKATTDEDPECCYAPALRENQEKYQIVGGDAQENGAEAASVKLIAGMLRLEFNTLYDRFRKAEKRKRKIVITAITAFALLVTLVAVIIMNQDRELKESKSVILAEKAMDRIKKGDYLGARRSALEAITLSYSPEAEAALRQSWEKNNGTLEGHSSIVYSVSWSPDGKYLASSSYDKTLIIWDAKSGERLKTLEGHSSIVYSVSWSPDGKYLASGSDDDTVIIWDAAGGQRLKTLKGHSNDVESVSWSPDGKYLASGSRDETVIIWDATVGEILKTLEGHSDGVWSVCWSPDGKYLASGSEDNTVIIWDANSGQKLKTLEGHSSTVESVSWSPDGKYLASGSDDETVIIWDATVGEILKTLEGHSDIVYSVSWSPDGKYLASGSYDETVILDYLYDDENYSELDSVPENLFLSDLSPDGNYSASVLKDYTAVIKNVKNDKVSLTLKGDFLDYAYTCWSPDGKYLMIGGSGSTVRIFNPNNGMTIQTFRDNNGEALFVRFTSDGRKIITRNDIGEILQWDFPPLDELIEKTKKWAGK